MNKPSRRPITATATATVTIEVTNLGSWGPDCNIEQVHRQASEAAVNRIRRLASDSIRVVGQPEIKTVIVERT